MMTPLCSTSFPAVLVYVTLYGRLRQAVSVKITMYRKAKVNIDQNESSSLRMISSVGFSMCCTSKEINFCARNKFDSHIHLKLFSIAQWNLDYKYVCLV